MRSASMLEKAKELAVILAFDVPVDKEAEKLAEELGIKIFKGEFRPCTDFGVLISSVQPILSTICSMRSARTTPRSSSRNESILLRKLFGRSSSRLSLVSLNEIVSHSFLLAVYFS